MPQTGTDMAVEWLKEQKLPLTLENWKLYALPENPPDGWEAETPPPLHLLTDEPRSTAKPVGPFTPTSDLVQNVMDRYGFSREEAQQAIKDFGGRRVAHHVSRGAAARSSRSLIASPRPWCGMGATAMRETPVASISCSRRNRLAAASTRSPVAESVHLPWAWSGPKPR